MSDDKEDTFRLFKSLNARLGSREEEGSVLGERFEQYWGELSSSLERIRNIDVESTTETTIETEVDILAGGDLSDVAREMLLQIGQDQRAHLLVTSTSGGHHFQANGRDLNAENFPRSTARFREGLRKLLRWKLLEMRGGKGEVFTLTDKGFTVFDKLKDEQNID